MFKKITVLFVCFVIFLLIPIRSFAQDKAAQTAVQTSSYNINTSAGVPQNFHTYSQVVFLEIISSISCQLSGIDPLIPQGKCLGPNGTNDKIGFVQNGGALGFLGKSIASSYDIPISSTQYVAYLGSHFGIARTAEAASPGSGFQGLLPFLPIWTAFRNITYLFFVLIFIVIGLGIMFRAKIDPRSVMTIQNSIPKIIIALIFITFSYAIVGFLIDVMHIAIYFIYGIMSGIPNTDISGLTPAKIQGANPITAANHLANSSYGLSSIASDVTGTVVGAIKDALGLSGSGGNPLSNLPVIGGVGDIFAGIIKHIPGLGLIKGFLDKIPFVGGFFDLLGNVGGGVVRAATNHSIANYLIHAVSVAAGIFTGIQAGQIKSASGGAEVSASFLGIGGGGGFSFDPGFLVGFPLGAIVGTATTAFTEVLLRELLPNLIAFFIVLIALFSAMFRLWFQLIKAYVYLFLYLVFAPFYIAIGVIPGMGSGLGPWFRNVVSNLSVFPTTYIMLLLGKVLIDSVGKSNGNVFVPPLLGDFSHSTSSFASLLGLGILLLTPEVVNMVRAALKAPDFKYAGAIGSAIGSGQKLVSSPVKGTWGKMVGEDARGNPRALTKWAQDKGGALGGMVFGGSFMRNRRDESVDASGNSTSSIKNIPIVKLGKIGRIFGKGRRGTPIPPTPPTPPATGGGQQQGSRLRRLFGRSATPQGGQQQTPQGGQQQNQQPVTQPAQPAPIQILNRAQRNVTNSGRQWGSLTTYQQDQELSNAEQDLNQGTP